MRRLINSFLNRFLKAPFREEAAKTEPINAVIYDCEIIRAIPDSEERLGEIEYCSGWRDFANMGISCIGAYDFLQDKYHIFLEDNFAEFWALADSREHIIGFNSLYFDDLLCAANDLPIKTTYDLLAEVRTASGQPPYYVRGETRGGYNLEALSQAKLGYGKSGSGAQAPILWQSGQKGAVINYCLLDIQITKKLFDLRHDLKDPTDGKVLKLRNLYER